MNIIKAFKEKFNIVDKNNELYIKRFRYNENSIYQYDFILSLKEKEYPKYLCEAYYVKTGQKLNLKHPKILNEKIQWLKIYDNKPIKTTLTDKVLVRDWIKEKIGEEYLKPVLWIGNNFDDIPFDKFQEKIIIKCNHGCKWQVALKNKDEFLSNSQLFELIKKQFGLWMTQTFFGWSDFETQYLNISPQIIIESFLIVDDNEQPQEIEIWCFNGKAKIIQKCKYINKNNKNLYRQICSYDENFNYFDVRFYKTNEILHTEPDEILRQAKVLSEKLAKTFKFVRVDWLIHQDKLYFQEMTFTPHSGFIIFPENHNELQIKFGKMLNLKGE